MSVISFTILYIGLMLTNQLVEDGNNYYYVDANGAMVRNTWVAIAADEDEDEEPRGTNVACQSQ